MKRKGASEILHDTFIYEKKKDKGLFFKSCQTEMIEVKG